MITPRLHLPCLLLACMLLGGAAQAQVLRLQIGAAVPTNSPWDVGLRQLASEWASLSNNRVQLQFPRSVVNASQDDIVQRLSYQLNGAILEVAGLNLLDPNTFYLALPSVIQTEAEFKAAAGAVLPLIQEGLADRYVILGFEQVGWIYLISNRPILEPADLAGLRVGVNADHEILIQQFQALGARPVKSSTSSFVLQFNANQLDVAYTSPLLVSTLWSQLRRSVSHLSELKLAPLYGVLVLNLRDWERIPQELRPGLRRAAEDRIQAIARESLQLEARVLSQLRGQGLTLTRPTPAQTALWLDSFTELQRSQRIGALFDPAFVERVNQAVQGLR